MDIKDGVFDQKSLVASKRKISGEFKENSNEKLRSSHIEKKEASEFLNKNSLLNESCLIVLQSMDKKTILAFRNIKKVKTIQFKDLNCLDVLTFKKIVIVDECLKEVRKMFKKK